ncbi:hypothetical protein RHGRI_009810 [Rhododendron griersonianum]|uniref:Uncharacterized protein n=1 Tax=Rhododendron griersonianum TaxID=479676 RepID=A0AAV6KGR3_9ERIC|nr:hypothetical protein RHGRI_009810 [Rhododendron griersonianum]
MRIFPRNFAPLAIGILFIFFTTFASASTLLPPDEARMPSSSDSLSDRSLCHPIQTIGRALKTQDLSGTLPPELMRLTHLQDISLRGNRLTGPIPIEFGNISTLANLTMEFNQLSGLIPAELGSLPLLETVFDFKQFYRGASGYTSKADHFEGLYNAVDEVTTALLERYQISSKTGVIQGSGLDGPIPLGIGFLTKLSDLRISDLNGSQASFPPLKNLTSLKTLILRSCNIIGPLPEYLGEMTNLRLLLRPELQQPKWGHSEHFLYYLTGNLLSGPVPRWMLENARNIDLSYNNFSLGSQKCQQRDTNLFGSSSKGNLS